MSRIRTYALELEVEIADDTSDALVELMLSSVVPYSTAGEAIDTGLFGADDHLTADVVALRYVGPAEGEVGPDLDRYPPARWTRITRPDGEELGYFCGFSYPGDPTRWHKPHTAEGRTCRGSAPTVWDRFTRAQMEATAAAQVRDRAR